MAKPLTEPEILDRAKAKAAEVRAKARRRELAGALHEVAKRMTRGEDLGEALAEIDAEYRALR